MATDPFNAYQEALKNLESAQRKVETYVGEIKDAASKLTRWDEVTIGNVGDISFPPEAMVASINAEKLPTAKQLAEALSEWHKARHSVNNAWSAIPKDRRLGLQPPQSR